MSIVVKPVHVGPTVVKGMDELMCDHSSHVGLLADVVLTQNDLQIHVKEVTLRHLNLRHLCYCKGLFLT